MKRPIGVIVALALSLCPLGCSEGSTSGGTEGSGDLLDVGGDGGAVGSDDSGMPSLDANPTSVDRDPAILSAFFGADGLPGAVYPELPSCPELASEPIVDGMPIVLSHEVVIETLDTDDFAITVPDGSTRTPLCADVAPADEENEDRTVLLVGDFGSPTNPPVAVEVVGELDGEGPQGELSLTGARVARIVPLPVGPSLVLAHAMGDEADIADPPNGMDCPSVGTVQVVQLIWAGGVTGDGATELDDSLLEAHRVTVEDGAGATREVTPIAFGDLGDRDNVVDLCLDTADRAVRVDVDAGTVTDPLNDPNPETGVEVTRR